MEWAYFLTYANPTGSVRMFPFSSYPFTARICEKALSIISQLGFKALEIENAWDESEFVSYLKRFKLGVNSDMLKPPQTHYTMGY